MSFAKQFGAAIVAGFVMVSGAAWAQAGGGDVPSDAKAAGTKESGPGSTGMSKGEAATKPTTNENKPSATGGQPGGAADKN